MRTTKIEWTERTWNPVTGCTKLSDGCAHCYAEKLCMRLHSIGNIKYINKFNLSLHPESLHDPFKWKKSSLVFVCSMGDLFHKDVPFEFIDEVFDIIKHTPQHTYQILTKRAQRMSEYCSMRLIPDNVWMGVTVENKKTIERIDFLSMVHSKVRFISCEPLLEDLGIIDLTNVDWIIVGGESGNQARPMRKDWVLNLLFQARTYNIPFFFKQWGTWGYDGKKRSKLANGKLLDGNIIQELPPRG